MGDNVIVIGIMIFVVICELAAIYEKMEGKTMNKIEMVETCLSGCMKILGETQNDLPGVAEGCMEKGMESISGFMQNTVTEDKARLKKMINGGYRNGKY